MKFYRFYAEETRVASFTVYAENESKAWDIAPNMLDVVDWEYKQSDLDLVGEEK